MGIERSTFLIDEKGVIRGIWRKVKVPGPRRRAAEGGRGAELMRMHKSPPPWAEGLRCF